MTTKPKLSALARAITRCEAAQAAYEAAYDAEPEADEDMKGQLFEAEAAAIDDLAKMPCASDAEFIEKLRFLLARDTAMFGPPDGHQEFGCVVIAVDRHFRAHGPIRNGKLRLAWPEP